MKIFFFKGAFFILLMVGLGNTSLHSEPKQTNLCEVRGAVDPLHREERWSKPLSGPLKGCVKGDTIHFQIYGTKVPYSSIVARFCDLDKTVSVENYKKYTHVVCSYHWKWAKQVTRTVLPDSR